MKIKQFSIFNIVSFVYFLILVCFFILQIVKVITNKSSNLPSTIPVLNINEIEKIDKTLSKNADLLQKEINLSGVEFGNPEPF